MTQLNSLELHSSKINKYTLTEKVMFEIQDQVVRMTPAQIYVWMFNMGWVGWGGYLEVSFLPLGPKFSMKMYAYPLLVHKAHLQTLFLCTSAADGWPELAEETAAQLHIEG